MDETCCPQYTIRLDSSKFKASKAQRQVLNRLRRYLEGETGDDSQDGAAGKHGGARDRGSQGCRGGGGGKKRDGSGGGDSKEAKQGSKGGGHGQGKEDGAPGNDAEGLSAVTKHVAASTVKAVSEAASLSNLAWKSGWELDVEKWAQVSLGR